jgi:hypothetical protein
MPLEHHRRVGRNGGANKADGRSLPVSGEIVALPMADRTPMLPLEIQPSGPGAELWQQIWADGITWIAPQTDMAAAIFACKTADALAEARTQWYSTMDPKDARVMIALGKQFMDALSALGFNPTARARLGVAEVKRVTALDKLMERRAQRTDDV